MIENNKKNTIGVNSGSNNRSKSKTLYTSSKPSFLIPFNASRFLNPPPRKSQTPTRQAKSPVPNKVNRASSTSKSQSQSASPSTSTTTHSEIKIRQHIKPQRSPNQSGYLFKIKESSKKGSCNSSGSNANSIMLNPKMGTTFNTAKPSTKNSNDLFSILHRKDNSPNVIQPSMTNQSEVNKTYSTNKNNNNFNTTNTVNMITIKPVTPPPNTEYNSNSNSKIQVHMKSNHSYQNMESILRKSNPEAAIKPSQSPLSVSGNRSTSFQDSKSFINNNTSTGNPNPHFIKKDSSETEAKHEKRMLAHVKSASEKRLKFSSNSKIEDNKPKIQSQLPSSAIKAKLASNSANCNKGPMSRYTPNINTKKQFREVNTSPLLRTKGGEKAPKSHLSNNSLKQKSQIQRTPTNQNKKQSPKGFTSPDYKPSSSNSKSNNNDNSPSIINSNTNNNTNNNTPNSLNPINNTPNNNNSSSISVQIKRNDNPSPNYSNILLNRVEKSNPLLQQQPISKTIIKIDSITKKGFDGQGMKKVNQDNYFIYKNLNRENTAMFIGVCDGHGMFGHDVSGYLISHLPTSLNSSLISKHLPLSNQSNLNTLLTDIFIQTNTNLTKDTSIDTTFSGSTCVSIVYTPEKITCANVGDSRAIIGRCVNGTWSSKNLSIDHKPNEQGEHDRIIQSGGRIEAYKDEEGNYIGPERVWVLDEDIPGLAMSRSFGDEKAQSVGVIAKPEIKEFQLEQCDKFVVLASDGIWEFIESEECVHMLKDFYLQNDASAALSHLYKESAKRWIQQEEVIDDITVVIIFFE